MYKIFSLGDSAICIQYEQVISQTLHANIINDYEKLLTEKFDFVKDIIPAYCSISIIYDFEKVKFISKKKSAFSFIKNWVLNCLQKTITPKIITREIKEIPVCYHKTFALDTENISANKNISIQELIELHYSKTYHVFMIGFLPGFPYMGLVDEKISFPRLNSPRNFIEAGSVGIAGFQTGIYPLNSPGGWNIIGKTPLQILNPNLSNPCLINSGDQIKFVPISLSEFNQLNQHEH